MILGNYYHNKTGNIYRVLKLLKNCDNSAAEGTRRVVYRNIEGMEFDRDETEFGIKFTPITGNNFDSRSELFMAIKVKEGNPATVTGMKCNAKVTQGKETYEGVAQRDPEGHITITIDERFDRDGPAHIELDDGNQSRYEGVLYDGIWKAK